MIDAPGDQTAPYAFHLFDLSQATAYTPGTVTDATLSPSRETDVYRFEATAGERYYFDAQRFTGGDIFWRLVNPFGKLVFDRTSFANDVGIVTLELTGAYTLLIEGPVGMTGQTSYRFNAQRIADDVKPLVFGQAQGIEGRQWTAGQLGGAAYLDGAMYAEVAHSATINVVHNMTLEAWIKVDRFADGGAATPILYKGNPSSGQRAYALWVNPNGSVTFSTWDNYVGTTTLTSNVADLIRADEWHHVAAVVNRDGSVATLYVDGLDRGSVGVVYFRDSFSIDTPLLIGRNLETGFGNFEGTLDEVRLWNVARTGAQIAGAKDAELVGTEAGLMMYLKANEGSGSVLGDASNQGNAAQIRNVYGAGSAVVAGRIDHTGQRDFYSFTLAEAKQLYFDSLTQNTGLTWTLSGPRGAVVNARSFTASDSFEFGAGSPVLDLVAGDYTLMIDAPGDQTAPYAFHLYDLSQATPYTPGTVTDGVLSPARESDLYQFQATAGDRYYFDAQRFSGGDIFWRLVNPFGKLVFDRTNFTSDVGIVTLELTGAYTLLIEGPVGMTGQTTYRFNAQRIADDVKPLVFGQAQGIDGRQWTSGQLGGAAYLDGAMYGEVASSATIDVTRTLTLEAWVKVDRFADSGLTPIVYKGNGAGTQRTYALWVNGADGSVVYSTSDNFGGTNIQEVTLATAGGLIAADEWHHVAVVADRNGIPNSTVQLIQIYVDGVLQANSAGGPQVFRIDTNANSTSNALLIGRDLEGHGNFEGTIDEVRLWNVARNAAQIQASMGAELLGSESGLVLYLKANEGTGSVLADASGLGNAAQIRNVYTAGSAVVAGKIDHPGQRDFYTFTLAQAKLLYFDSLTQNASLTWTLSGPRGTVVNARSFTASDSFEFGTGSPVLDLVAGDYTLMVDAPGDQTSPYAFHLYDLSQATVLTPGTIVNGDLTPARETDVYRFTANSGDQFFFDGLSFAGGEAYWKLINPFGKIVFDRTAFPTDVGVLTLELSGAYTLLIEGRVTTTGIATYSFNVDPRGNVPLPTPPAGTPLVLGATTSDAISVAGEQDRYTFTLGADARVDFDSLTNSANLVWTLTGPQGALVLSRAFSSSDSSAGTSIFDLVAGNYALTVSGTGTSTGSYSLRLFDLAQASALSFNASGTAVVTSQLSPANETDL